MAAILNKTIETASKIPIDKPITISDIWPMFLFGACGIIIILVSILLVVGKFIIKKNVTEPITKLSAAQENQDIQIKNMSDSYNTQISDLSHRIEMQSKDIITANQALTLFKSYLEASEERFNQHSSTIDGHYQQILTQIQGIYRSIERIETSNKEDSLGLMKAQTKIEGLTDNLKNHDGRISKLEDHGRNNK